MTLSKVIPQELSNFAYWIQKYFNDNGIPHAIIGGIAVGAYAKPRTTSDVDVVIHRKDLDKVLALFPNHEPLYMGNREGYKIDVDADGVEDFDVLIAEDDETFLLKSQTDYHGLNVLSAYNLIYMKLMGRSKDSNDIIQILAHMNSEQRNGFVPYLKERTGFLDEQRLEDMIEEYESLAQIAELEAANNFRAARIQFRNRMLKKLGR